MSTGTTRTDARTKFWAGALLALLLALIACGGIARTAHADPYDPADWAPSIWSDKADYGPGELVTLAGAQWAPGERVNVVVNDDAGKTWRRDVDVTADELGRIEDQFNLPDWFVAEYSVRATGADGAVVATSFTDANTVYSTNRLPAGSGELPVTAGSSATFVVGAHKEGSGPVEVTGIAALGNTSSCGTATMLPAAWLAIDQAVPIGLGGGADTNVRFRVSAPAGATGTYKALVKFAVNGNAQNPAQAGNGFALCVRAEPPATQNQTIAFAAPSGVTYGDADVDLPATATSGLPVGYSSSTGAVCTIVGGKAHLVAAGTCTITATQGGDSSWNAAAPVTRSFTIARAPLSASADDQSRVYGDENPELTGMLSGVRNGDAIAVAGETSASKASGVGEYAIVPKLIAEVAVLANYQEPALTDGTLTVTQAPLTANVSVETVEYGEPATFEAEFDGLRNGDEPSVVDGALSCEPAGIVVGGPYAIECSGLSAQNYAIAYSGGSLTVTRAELKVEAEDLTRVYGESSPAPTYELAGFKNGETRGDAGVTGEAVCSIEAGSDAGTYGDAITCAPGDLEAANYRFAAGAKGTLTIEKASQHITFAALGVKQLGDADFDPAAAASSGLEVSYAAAPASVCGIVAGKVRIVGVGTCAVTASQGGDHNHRAAPDVTRQFGAIYRFTGFFAPIDMGANMLNKAKAGSTIPVKFRLGGDRGLGILAAGAPSSVAIACSAGALVDTVEEVTTATSGLKYDAVADQYVYNWKTDSKFASSCRQLVVKLADGESYRASFTFTK